MKKELLAANNMPRRLIDILKTYSNDYPAKLYSNEIIRTTASFVIPAYNSEDSISTTIKSIIGQNLSHLINEIIVINDNSTDRTREIVRNLIKEYSNQIKIILLNNRTRKYSAFTRNKGLRLATGDVICFLDSDIYIPKDYLNNHLSVHQNIKNCITFSLRTNTTESDLEKLQFPIIKQIDDERFETLKENQLLKNKSFFLDSKCSLADLCKTCAVSYKRDLLLKIKGCPNNFVGWGYNDTVIAAKAISQGAYVIPLVDVVVYHNHHHPRSGNEEIKKREKKLNQKKYESMLELPVHETFHYNIKKLENL